LAQFNWIAEPGLRAIGTFVAGTSGPWHLSTPVTNVIVGWNLDAGAVTSCLVQSVGEFFLCPDFSTVSAASPPLLSDGWMLAPPPPPYLQGFDAFDHLRLLAIPGCQQSLLGIGVFRPAAGPIPRKLQHLTLTQTGQFAPTEVATPFAVTTYGMIAIGDGSALVGMLGEDSGQTVFGLAEVKGCSTWNLLGTWAADGNWRTPDAPQFLAYGPRVPMTPGIALAGFKAAVEGGDGYVYVNYDGYTIRAWEFTATSIDNGSPEPRSIIWKTHETRSDLVFAP
jgi:hypothetical protein